MITNTIRGRMVRVRSKLPLHGNSLRTPINATHCPLLAATPASHVCFSAFHQVFPESILTSRNFPCVSIAHVFSAIHLKNNHFHQKSLSVRISKIRSKVTENVDCRGADHPAGIANRPNIQPFQPGSRTTPFPVSPWSAPTVVLNPSRISPRLTARPANNHL